jgi:hypothetical protein
MVALINPTCGFRIILPGLRPDVGHDTDMVTLKRLTPHKGITASITGKPWRHNE